MSQSRQKVSSMTYATTSSPLLEQLSQPPAASTSYLASQASAKLVALQMPNGQESTSGVSAQALRAFQTDAGEMLQVIHMDASTLAALAQLGTSTTDVTGFQQALVCAPSTVTAAMPKDNSGATVAEEGGASTSTELVALSAQNNDVGRALAAATADQTVLQIPNGVSLQQLLQSVVSTGGMQQIYMVHVNNTPPPQGVSITGAEKPAQSTVSEEEPFYVNAKQYKRIMQRRLVRGRLESQGRIPKTRKKYLHESRHLHALNRVRGEGGRFNPGGKKAHSSKSNGDDCFSDHSDASPSLSITERAMEKGPQKILPKPS